MAVSFEELSVGAVYDRPFLASLWGYRSAAAISKGVVTPANQNVIVLFITKEKQGSQIQYNDSFDGEVLAMDGEDGHRSDRRLAESGSSGDEVHMFYRDRHHEPFMYHGRMLLVRADLHADSQPSRFEFRRLFAGATRMGA